ncbi:MAG: hypothetical protein QHH30_07975, partial [candidate division NC10 bacterium]|nr:hypothetical protein [candidate division NC10 bacterium]
MKEENNSRKAPQELKGSNLDSIPPLSSQMEKSRRAPDREGNCAAPEMRISCKSGNPPLLSSCRGSGKDRCLLGR